MIEFGPKYLWEKLSSKPWLRKSRWIFSSFWIQLHNRLSEMQRSVIWSKKQISHRTWSILSITFSSIHTYFRFFVYKIDWYEYIVRLHTYVNFSLSVYCLISWSYVHSISTKIWDWCNLYKNVLLIVAFTPTFYSTHCICI